MDKETFEVLQSEMTKGFEQSIFIGAKKMIELSAKYVLTNTPDNASLKKGAEERLVRLLAYCLMNEQPVSSTALIRILRESETDKDLMDLLQYDCTDAFERSVNEVVYACLNFFSEIGEAIEDFEQEMINHANC
ncbi:MAG: hypothetical protein IJ598_00010 [Ruminococcus sp.]|nr:hypothetical protein [Ruminococcus sp.]